MDMHDSDKLCSQCRWERLADETIETLKSSLKDIGAGRVRDVSDVVGELETQQAKEVNQ